MDYYIQWTCPGCDEENFYGLCRTYLSHNDKPCVSLGEGQQESFDCAHCEETFYTGELELLSEDEI